VGPFRGPEAHASVIEIVLSIMTRFGQKSSFTIVATYSRVLEKGMESVFEYIVSYLHLPTILTNPG